MGIECFLANSDIEDDPSQHVHLAGVDPAGLAVPDRADAALAEAGEPRHAAQRRLHVLAALQLG